MSRFYWALAVTLDALHIPFAIIVMALGDLWMPTMLHATMILVIVILQILCLGCPLNVVTCWLRRKKEPEYDYWGSITFWLFQRYGRWVAVPLLIFYGFVAYFVVPILFNS